MNKDWLIRTKNNHILGPVSKDKIKELISNGSIKGDDEICSGNGFWIYIREQDLVAKHIFEDNPQSFNPVQEAQATGKISPLQENPNNEVNEQTDESITTVINLNDISDELNNTPSEPESVSLKTTAQPSGEGAEVDAVYPSAEDLEYPDVEDIVLELKQEIPIDMEQDDQEIESDPLEFKEITKEVDITNLEAEVEETSEAGPSKVVSINSQHQVGEPPIPRLKRRRRPVNKKPAPKTSRFSSLMWYLFMVILLAVAIVGVLEKTKIINEINKRVQLEFFPPAYAQTSTLDKKKSG